MQATLSTDMIRLATTRRERAISELDDIDELVRLYRARLLRFVSFSIGDPDLAETIVQDCFLKAYRARESFRGDCSVQTWLTGIALNLVRDHQRTQKFQFWRKARKTAVNVSDVATKLTANQSSPEAQLLAQEQARRVGEVLQELSLKQRTVFLMRFQEEMEIAEIVAATGMHVNTVKTHLHRAVKAVRERVGGR